MVYIFLYYQLFHQNKFDNVKEAFERFSTSDNFYPNLILVLLLMLVNWSIEALKWKSLLKEQEKISFFKSFKAVFAGLTVSIFTPNRVGEFLGRVFVLQKTNPWKAIFVTIVGSFSQLMVTLLVGFSSFIYFSYAYLIPQQIISLYVFYATVTTLGLAIALLVIFYIKVQLLYPIMEKIIPEKWKKIRLYFSVFSRFTTKKLLTVFAYSFVRYLVFTLQFVILIKTFQLPIHWFAAALLVSILFFVMSAIPTITLAELGVRGSIVIEIFKIFFIQHGVYQSSYDFGVFSASTMLWLINLALPAVLGTFFVFQFKILKE